MRRHVRRGRAGLRGPRPRRLSGPAGGAWTDDDVESARTSVVADAGRRRCSRCDRMDRDAERSDQAMNSYSILMVDRAHPGPARRGRGSPHVPRREAWTVRADRLRCILGQGGHRRRPPTTASRSSRRSTTIRTGAEASSPRFRPTSLQYANDPGSSAGGRRVSGAGRVSRDRRAGGASPSGSPLRGASR